MAAFLLDMSERYARRGFSATRFNLTMARTEIANYLRMAPRPCSSFFANSGGARWKRNW